MYTDCMSTSSQLIPRRMHAPRLSLGYPMSVDEYLHVPQYEPCVLAPCPRSVCSPLPRVLAPVPCLSHFWSVSSNCLPRVRSMPCLSLLYCMPKLPTPCLAHAHFVQMLCPPCAGPCSPWPAHLVFIHVLTNQPVSFIRVTHRWQIVFTSIVCPVHFVRFFGLHTSVGLLFMVSLTMTLMESSSGDTGGCWFKSSHCHYHLSTYSVLLRYKLDFELVLRL
ncbi:hypothetical protein H257_14793 [Aphanomyces astaci]|uniref:Uncharacterized protein n=1 Tax=Aphanomyces astaci TaxID=112090 RepID=W4FQ10_APHAT|nr:hypothetical protein H257_14793 [Aphanomyces astaci]ETV69557.1 hypothetical protein H257_14793 [Aphanomyces astaci]|eukprot:XP_009840981.1 hypothetical protein H257_14793 [Aphanomyces astaci]